MFCRVRRFDVYFGTSLVGGLRQLRSTFQCFVCVPTIHIWSRTVHTLQTLTAFLQKLLQCFDADRNVNSELLQ